MCSPLGTSAVKCSLMPLKSEVLSIGMNSVKRSLPALAQQCSPGSRVAKWSLLAGTKQSALLLYELSKFSLLAQAHQSDLFRLWHV